jgi:protoporphyrinogen/coproporphyrinogen III oxidase
MKQVLVIGGGLSGLATAFRLRGRAEVTLVEAKPELGGNLRTTSTDGFRVEWGPNGFLDGKPGMLQLCRDVGLGSQLIPASEGSRKNRYVFWNGRIEALPSGPLGILRTPLLSLRGKLELFAEPLRQTRAASPEESVTAFATRRMGKEAARVFMDALVTGIHAADPEKLSVRAAFPRLVKFETESGSLVRGVLRSQKQKKLDAQARGEKPAPQRMWSFRGGLQILVDALRDVLGPMVHTGVESERLQRLRSGRWQLHTANAGVFEADEVVLTVPAYEQARLLSDIAPSLAADLASITYNRILVVALGYKASEAPTLDGFGYIAPHSLRREALGVQWCSSIFPERAPPGFVLWRALCGGASRPELMDYPDDEILRRVHTEMIATMGVRGTPVFSQVIRWPKAIPEYHLGHLERVERIETAVKTLPGLHVTGNAFYGVAMNDVVEQANLIADRIAVS